ncbi:MAG: LysE family translocator [Cyclobacteriaceae bacterium]
MTPFLNGLLFGLIFVFSLGPAFFSLVQTSVQKGFTRALLLAIGISLSDIVFVILSLMGITSWMESDRFKIILSIVGAIVLISYGIYSWFKKPKIYSNEGENKQDVNNVKYIVKGFLLNGFNPFILVFWMGIIGIVSVNFEYNTWQQQVFFSGVLATIFSTDLLKAFIANRLRSIVTPNSIMIMNRSVGVILILFGLHMFYFLFSNYG